MNTTIKVSNEIDYYNKVEIEVACKRNIDEVDAKTVHEAANLIIETMAKYMPSEKQEQSL